MRKLVFLLVLLFVFAVPVLAQDDAETATSEPVVAVEVSTKDEPVIEVRGDGARAIVLLGVLGGLAVAIYSGVRTHQLDKKLRDFAETTYADVTLTSELEEQFARLPLRHQEAISKIMDVVDPLTRIFPGDLDDKTAAWVREISDGLPVKDKPEPAPQG